jgi:hypothetical protein
MPYDLIISRKRGAGMLGRLFNKSAGPFQGPDLLFAGLKFRGQLQPGGDIRIPHPDDQFPFFTLRLDDEGNMVCTTSYSNHRFLRNFADMADAALRIAKHFGARVVIESDNAELRADNIDTYFDVNGRHVQFQIGFFRQQQEELDKGGGALEYPLMGIIDRVGSYFVPGAVRAAGEFGGMEAIIRRLDPALSWQIFNESHAYARTAGDLPVLKMAILSPGEVVFIPAHGRAAFSISAPLALDCACRLRDQCGAEPQFLRKPVEPARWAEIEEHARGLGVDFFEWAGKAGILPAGG